MQHAQVEWRFDRGGAAEARRLRRAFMAVLRANGTGDFDAAELVYSELVGNAIRHTAGPIVVRLAWSGEVPTLIVDSAGGRFSAEAELPVDPLSENGRGMFIVRALSLDVRVKARSGDRTAVLARLPIHRAA
jgi:anti-sigma regulatory factor (Ser/Thr protein kinase)